MPPSGTHHLLILLPSLLLLLLLTLPLQSRAQCSSENTSFKNFTIVEGYGPGNSSTGGVHIYNFEDDLQNAILILLSHTTSEAIFENYFTYENKNLNSNGWIDREAIANDLMNPYSPVKFEFRVVAYDGMLAVLGCIDVELNVLDLDDNVPMFNVQGTTTLLFNEDDELPMGVQSRTLPSARDNDQGINGTQVYELIDPSNKFALDFRYYEGTPRVRSLSLITTQPLDREEQASYSLQLRASEGNDNPDSDTLDILVQISERCDEPPIFSTSRYQPTLSEGAIPNSFIVNVSATDEDDPIICPLRYSIVTVCARPTDSDPCTTVHNETFVLDSESGRLTLHNPIDREQFSEYEVTIQATDGVQSSSTAMVVISIEDVNDNDPMVTYIGLTSIPEVQTVGVIGDILVTDADDGRNAQVSVRLLDNSTGQLVISQTFRIEKVQEKYVLKLNEMVDFETQLIYKLVIEVIDNGTDPRTTYKPVEIEIEDHNDHPPKFVNLNTEVRISEGATINMLVVTVQATDDDSTSVHNTIHYTLPPSNASYPHQDVFHIEAESGEILVNVESLDYENISQYNILVAASNILSQNQLSTTQEITVFLNNENDNRPMFVSPTTPLSVNETVQPGHVIGSVVASDADNLEPLTYSLASSNSIFSITEGGVLSLIGSLDYETVQSHQLMVEVTDGPHVTTSTVAIQVIAENDERPEFLQIGRYVGTVVENQPSGTFVVSVEARDPDDPAEPLQYSIVQGDHAERFRIDSSGNIYTTEVLDREMTPSYTFFIRASDGKLVSELRELFIQVMDVNDHTPEFIGAPYEFEILENNALNQEVGQISVHSLDEGVNQEVRFSITAGNENRWFQIDAITGTLRTNNTVLDRETIHSPIELQVEVRDLGVDSRMNVTRVMVVVADMNDNPPQFLQVMYSFVVREDYPIGQVFGAVRAHDPDSFGHNQTVYQLSDTTQEGMNLFHIDRSTGNLSLVSSLDYESMDSVQFTVIATDDDRWDFQVSTMVFVNITNARDLNLTVDIPTQYSIYENVPANTTIISFEVTDTLNNSIDRLVYTLTGEDNSLSPHFGIKKIGYIASIFTRTNSIDREADDIGEDRKYRLKLNVSDPDMTEDSYGFIVVVLTITILDVNDNPPVFAPAAEEYLVEENGEAGQTVVTLEASDLDNGENQTIQFSLDAGVPFNVTRVMKNGRQLAEIRVINPLDRELHSCTSSRYTFFITARDTGSPTPREATKHLIVNVGDKNDNSPILCPQGCVFSVPENLQLDEEVGTIVATDADCGTFGDVTIEVTPGTSELHPIFELDESTGKITLKSKLDRETEDNYTFSVRAVDGGGLATTSSITIIVTDYNDHHPEFQNSSFTVGISETHPVGVAFSSLFAVDQDAAPYNIVRYALADHSLSDIFCLDSDTGAVSICEPEEEDCPSTEVIDYERRNEYKIDIVAYDNGVPRRYTQRTLTVQINNINEHSPEFDAGHISILVNESLPRGNPVLNLQAYDLDAEEELHYTVIQQAPDSYFRWDDTMGELLLDRELNYDTYHSFRVDLQVEDRAGHTQNLPIYIHVRNENTYDPVFDTPLSTTLSISESTAVGSNILTVHATDGDNQTSDAVSYTISSGNTGGAFAINPFSGALHILMSLDYETTPTYSLNLLATDTGEPTRQSEVLVITVEIVDENDEAPIFSASEYTFSVPENSPLDTRVNCVSATDRDGGEFGVSVYSIAEVDTVSLPFTINSRTGCIFSTSELDHEDVSQYQFDVIARDKESPSMSATAAVTVSVDDENDNGPRFSQSRFSFYIAPDYDITTALGTATTSDPDSENNGQFTFSITQPNPDLSVTLGEDGELMIESAIPSPHLANYSLLIRVTSTVSGDNRHDDAIVEINIETENDHHPRFEASSYDVEVSESADVGYTVFNLAEVISDVDGTGSIEYSFAQSYSQFALDYETGLVTLNEPLNYEDIDSYELKVVATDSFTNLLRYTSTTIRVRVEDANDHAPVFVDRPSDIVLSGLPYKDIELFTVVAEDEDVGDHGSVGYSIVEDASQLFQINGETGVVSNRVVLMSDGTYSFIIRAFDKGTPLKSSNITISVQIVEASNPPQFANNNNPLVLSVVEDVEPPEQIHMLSTTPTSGSYHIVYSNASQGQFGIDSNSYLVLESELNYETASHYQLIIEARNIDSNGYRLSSFLLVTIVVTDVNNNKPVFDHIPPQVISESQATDVTLFTVRATDIDTGSNGDITYAISGGNVGNIFQMNRETGEVSLAAPLDRETTDSYELEIRALDGSTTNQLNSQVTVSIEVADVNDNAPTFSQTSYTISIYEHPHTHIGDRVIQIAADDPDLNPQLYYRLELLSGSFMGSSRNPSSDTFSIDYDSGEITTHRDLNREEIDRYLLRIEAGDSIPEHTITTELEVHVLDVNDHSPHFTHSQLSDIYVQELRPVDWLVLDSLQVEDEDLGPNAMVKFSLGSGWSSGFKIDPWSGVIRVAEEFNYDIQTRSISGEVLAVDLGIPARTATTIVNVNIVDVNNHPPILDHTHFSLDIAYHQLVDALITKFNYSDDLDSGFNTATDMEIPSYYSDALDLFRLSYKGDFSVRRQITESDVGNQSFLIGAIQDTSVPHCPQFNQATYMNVTVTIHRANSHAPNFVTSYTQVSLSESTAVGTIFPSSILNIAAEDEDNDDITYYLFSSEDIPFAILDPQLPVVTITSQLDADSPSNAVYILTVEARDNGFPSRNTQRTLTVIITDVNDLKPQFTEDAYSAWVNENAAFGTSVLTVEAVDPDQGISEDITYELLCVSDDCPLPFEISSTGVITTTGSIDYEMITSYVFFVVARDSQQASDVSVTVDVAGENEYAPRFELSKYEFEVVIGGKWVVVGQVQASDEDNGEDGVLIYSFLDQVEPAYDILDINSTSGEIFLIDQTGTVIETSTQRRKRDVDTSGELVQITRTVQAIDSGRYPEFDTTTVEVSVPASYFKNVEGTSPAPSPGSSYIVIIIIVVVAVSLVILIFAGIVVTAIIFKRRGKNKKWKVGDTRPHLSGGSIEMTSERCTHNGTGQGRHHTTTLHTGQGSSSEHSYTGTADDEMESGNEIQAMQHFNSHSSPLPIKPHLNSSPRARSTSDLASTVGTEGMQSQSESHPYTKAQLMRIYAANEGLLDDNISHDSVHMFGSEGGGEADGELDINNLIFQKINDLEDDEESTTLMDDDASTTYSKGRGPVLAGSGGAIDIMPAEEREDPITYTDSIKTWIPPSGRSVDETIDEITGTSSFASQEEPIPRRHGYDMSGFSHSQGASLYGVGATQDTFVGMHSQPKHYNGNPKRNVHDYAPPMYYAEDHDRLPREHDRDRPRYTPRTNHRYGSASVLPANHDYRREGRHVYRSQDLAPSYQKYSPYVPGRRPMMHHSYMTPTEGTDDGTVTPQTALTGDYYLSSSSTSLTSTNVSGTYSQTSRRQMYN